MVTQHKPSAIRLDTLIYRSGRSNDGQAVGQIVPDFYTLLHFESASSRGQWIRPKVNVAICECAEVILDVCEVDQMNLNEQELEEQEGVGEKRGDL